MSLKRPEEDELEETLTGMDYIPYTLENADAFTGSWNSGTTRTSTPAASRP